MLFLMLMFSTLRDAWDSFIASRFNTNIGERSASALTTRIEELDLELDLFQEQLALAKRRRNSVVPVYRIPSELLVIVFTSLQAIWKPAYHDQVKIAEGEKSYTFGWMTVTHVCHSWRKVRSQQVFI